MLEKWIVGLLVCFGIIGLTAAAGASVECRPVTTGEGIEIWIGGDLFTAYRFGEGFEQKAVFYPVIASNGAVVNREIPFNNEELKKAQDHPHHQSVFMGYGDVDGKDFWSSAHGETIQHRAFLETRVQGERNSESSWSGWTNRVWPWFRSLAR